MFFPKKPRGVYITRADAYGSVRPDNSDISTTGDSTFTVLGTGILSQNTQKIENNKEVLAATYPVEKGSSENQLPLNILILLLIAYVMLRAFRQRKSLKEIFQRNISFKEKVMALRMFLL